MDAWDRLRNGDNDEALRVMLQEYRKDNTLSSAIQLGVVHMLLYEWRLASKHFEDFIRHSKHSADVMFKLLGTAKWCSGDEEGAIVAWQRGLDTDYSDSSGGVTIPLHLYFASLSSFNYLNVTKIEEQLLPFSQKIEYPGLLASVALGNMDVEVALRYAGKSDPHGEVEHQWKILFWNGLYQLKCRNYKAFRERMTVSSNVSWELYDNDKGAFIDRIWSSEYFLARHVCGTDSFNPGGC